MVRAVVQLAELAGVPVNVVWSLAVILLCLTVGTLLRLVFRAMSQSTDAESWKRLESLLTWWILSGLLVLIVALGRTVAASVFAVLSLLGMREYQRLAGRRLAGTAPWWCAYAAVPIHYLLIWAGCSESYWKFIPVWVLLLLLTLLVVHGLTANFLETVGIIFLGLMLIVFFLSHAVLLLDLPARMNPVAGAEGLFVYLVVLTEWNDIAQALAGRRFGRRKIAPVVSPHKTWEGFLLGSGIAVLSAVLLAPWLTPFGNNPRVLERIGLHVPYLVAVCAGALIAVGGFLGDITVSAIKREMGAKDSGTILPGQGGLLDRVDSLIVTAPLFYYFTRLLYE